MENYKKLANEEIRVQVEKLKEFKTWELVEELKTREGVKTTIVEPHVDEKVEVNGPAIVLVVID